MPMDEPKGRNNSTERSSRPLRDDGGRWGRLIPRDSVSRIIRSDRGQGSSPDTASNHRRARLLRHACITLLFRRIDLAPLLLTFGTRG